MRTVVNGFSLDSYRWRRERATGLAVPSAGPAGKPAVSNGHHDGSFIIDANLILYLPLWQFDVPTAKTFKSVDQNQYLATVTGALWGPTGRTFDGIDDEISLPATAGIMSGASTLALWLYNKGTGHAEDRLFLTKRDAAGTNYQLSIGPLFSNNLRSYNGVSGLTSIPSYAPPVSSWVYLSFRRTAVDVITLGVNGVATATFAHDWGTGTGAVLFLGGDSAIGGYNLGCVIGEVWAYSRLLAVAEDAHNYNASRWRYL